MKMQQYEVKTKHETIQITATCKEAAELEVEERGIGPVVSVKLVVGGRHGR